MHKTNRIFTLFLAFVVFAALGSGCSKKAKEARHIKEGDRLYTAGDYVTAENEYIEALRINHTNGYVFGKLGLIYYEDGRLARAYPFLLRGYQLDTNNVDLRLKIGQFFLAAGKPNDARSLAQSVLQARPSDTEAPLLMAESAISLKEIDETRKYLRTLTSPPANKGGVLLAMATLDYRLRDFKKAQAGMEAARDADPQSGAVHGALATVYLAQSNLAGAASEFELSLKSAPYRSNRRLRYAQFKLSNGEFDAAKKVLYETVTNAPGYLPGLLAVADVNAAEKNYAEADRLLSIIFNLDPNNYDALFLSGRVGILQGDYLKAVSQFERMAKLYPKNSTILYQLAMSYTALNNSSSAIATIKQAIAYKQGFTEAQLLLAQLQVAANDTPSAITSLKQLLAQNPKSFQGMLLLGDAYRSQGSYDDAEAVYRNAIKQYPTNAEPPMLLGILYRAENRREEARKQLLHALDLAPGLITTVEQLTDLEVEDKQFDQAMERVKKISAMDTNAPEPALLMAKVLMAQHSPLDKTNDIFTTQAANALLESIKNHPDFVSSYMVLARVYSDSGLDQKAVDILNTMLEKHGQEQNGWILLGTMLEKQKKVSEAEEAYTKLLAVNPQSLIALNNLGCIYAERGQLDKAAELLKKARALYPNDPSLADSLGWLYWKRGDYPQAQTLCLEAAAKIPYSPDVQFHVGVANYMMGNDTGALNALKFAADSKDDFPKKELSTNFLNIIKINPATATKADRQLLEKRLKDAPDDQIALVRLADIYALAGEMEKATEAYEGVIKISPKNLHSLKALAKFYAKAPGTQARAYDLALAAYKIDSEDSEFTGFLGQMAYAQGNYQAALNIFQQLKRTVPFDKDVQYRLGWALYTMGYVDAAMQQMEAVASYEASTNRMEAARFLEFAKLSTNPAAALKAVAQINETLKKDPQYVPALVALGFAQSQKPDIAAAKGTFEKVLSRYSFFAPAMRQLVILHSLESDEGDKSAVELSSKIREYYPVDPDLDRATAIICYRTGDFQKATKLFRNYVDDRPTDAAAFYYLGMSQLQVKQRTEAKKSLTKAVELKLSGSLLEDANRALATLK